ncbi:MAG TPA: GNAT family N-acetyltransferase [Anaerolineaceae bacterium]|nr:GNAT family N-acetyltransferase [Anaerolineaceae bacterium]HPN52345.1 GNAT family N-acetyltransferase [Anaerolineaceae bacterium]
MMMSKIELINIDPLHPALHLTLARIWNAAVPPSLSVSDKFFKYNLEPALGEIQDYRLALADGIPAGFIQVSALPDTSWVSPPEMGWVNTIFVDPHFQHSGIGAALLQWGETWLKEQGCTRARLGGSLRPFAPGLPVDCNSVNFFLKQNYHFRQSGADEWDVARDLGDGLPISRKPLPETGEIRPAHPEDQDLLSEFFTRVFHGRWQYEYEEFLRIGGRISDFLILLLDQKVEGFCWITLPDSKRPLDRYFLNDLPQPWGQLGPIGVSAEVRKFGWGGLLLQSGLEQLRKRNTRGCVIDWTGLLEFYGKYDFAPFHQYQILIKDLA